MNPPSPQPSSPRSAVDEAQIRNWLKLRDEVAELHARLEYLKLIVTLGVGRR